MKRGFIDVVTGVVVTVLLVVIVMSFFNPLSTIAQSNFNQSFAATNYSESAVTDESSDWDALHTAALAHDGDWGTYGLCNNPAIVCYIQENYSLPVTGFTTITGAKFEYKTSSTGGSTNLTIPANCFTQNPFRFNVTSNQTTGTNYSCYTGSGWISLVNNSGEDIYEDAVWFTGAISQYVSGGSVEPLFGLIQVVLAFGVIGIVLMMYKGS